MLSIQWNNSSSNKESFLFHVLSSPFDCLSSLKISFLKTLISDNIESHKLGRLSIVDGAPFIMCGYRTFGNEKLEGREWKPMPIFPFRDFGEGITYMYHTSEIAINNEVILIGGSCGGTCAHEKVFKFNKNKEWVRLQDLSRPRKAHGSGWFSNRYLVRALLLVDRLSESAILI